MNVKLADLVTNCSTLVDILDVRAHYQPEQLAYTFLMNGETEAISLTYGEFNQRVKALAALLQGAGMKGERALLLHPPGIDYIIAFLACLCAGVIAVPAYPPKLNRNMLRLQAIIKDAQAKLVLTTSSALAMVENWLEEASNDTAIFKNVHWLATDDVSIKQAGEWRKLSITENALAFLQYTSGSTSAPKGVMVSHSNLFYNSELLYRHFGHTAESVLVSWLPPYHDMGLILGILQPLYGGFPCIMMSPFAFIQNPFRWLQAISRYRATTSGGPNFAYDLCVNKITPEQCSTLDLSSWQLAFNGAEPVSPETLKRFTETFADCGFRPEAFYPAYGLAEGTLIVSGGIKAQRPVIETFLSSELEQHHAVVAPDNKANTRQLTGCGHTLGTQKIVIVDPNTCAFRPDGQVGEIWLRGQSVARGYWLKPVETKQTLQAYLSDTGEGPFLRTGDLGFLLKEELFITGRIKDMIISDGRNYYPQDIESTIEKAHPALRLGCSAVFSVVIDGIERLVVAVEVNRTYHFTANDNGTTKTPSEDTFALARAAITNTIRNAVAEEHDLRVYTVVLIKAGHIPKTSSGKIQRHACKEAFLAGTLSKWGEIDNARSSS